MTDAGDRGPMAGAVGAGGEANGGATAWFGFRTLLLGLGVLLLLSFAVPLLLFLPDLGPTELGNQLSRPALLRAVVVSLISATLATAIMGVLGVPLAYLMARDEVRFARTCRVLVLIPLVLPPVAAGVLLLNIYGPEGLLGRLLAGSGWTLVNTVGGIVLAQVFVAAPFVVLSAEAAFRAVDPALEQAAATLGQPRGRTFQRVSLPLARYGLAAGLVLAWMRAVGEFGATMVMAYHPHSLPVYLWVELSGRGLSAALPVALVALVLAALVLFLVQGLARAGRGRRAEDPTLRGPAHEPESMVAESFAPVAVATGAYEPELALDLRCRLGSFELDVELEAGREIVSLFGPSGAGKTTLLRLVSGLTRPDGGWLRLDDRYLFRAGPGGPTDRRDSSLAPDAPPGGDAPPRLTDAAGEVIRDGEVWVPAYRRPIGMVFQQHTLFPHLSVLDNILFGARATDPESVARARELVRMTRLDGLEERYPHELSGGQQQRVALARALLRRPRVLLLDEPFSSLDSNMKERLLLDVRRIHETVGLSVLYVTHDLRDACSLADRLAVIDDGRILQIGDPLEVIRRPATHAVGRFVGMRNLFQGRVVRRDGDRVVLGVAGLELEAECVRDFRPGQEVHFGVRPEDIVILKPDRPLRPPADENVLEGRIVLERLRGPTYTLTFRADRTTEAEPPIDLEVELPVRSYRALGIRDRKGWRVSIRRSALHILTAQGRS